MPRYPALILLTMLVMSAPASADICISGIRDNGSVVPGAVFPNWLRVRVASFDIMLCRDCAWAPEERLSSLTVANFGSLPAGGLSTVYWSVRCGKTVTPPLAMTYAGDYRDVTGTHPAWTWAGKSPDLAWCPDYCGTAPCGAVFTVDLYATIAPCAWQGNTVSLGFPAGPAGGGREDGALWDSAGCTAPSQSLPGPAHEVVWAKRVGGEGSGEGDTVSYTIYYGRPGAGGSSACIIGTLAPGTRYVPGSAEPGPDPGWGPHPGAPEVLRWTMNPRPVAGGRTSAVSFRVVRGVGGDSVGVFWPDSTCGEKPARKKGIWDR